MRCIVFDLYRKISIAGDDKIEMQGEDASHSVNRFYSCDHPFSFEQLSML
jgi:hypothetical protein